MISLYNYIVESLPLDMAKEYVKIKRNKKYEGYMNIFWKELEDYVVSHGGNVSRNKHRLYIPYSGPAPSVTADDTASSGSSSGWVTTRETIKNIVAMILDERGQWIDQWDYIGGLVDVAFKDQQGNMKVRKGQKIGKLIAKDTIPTPNGNTNALDLFSADPVRLSKNIKSSISANNLWLVISNHAYDVAGMSTNRDWTSCMNLFDGECKYYVEKDIEYGTLVCYIIDRKDTNIEHPYGRVLIKPYKLQRPNYHGFIPCPIVYAPEVTVYSPYIGLKPIREWLKDICEEIQSGDGILKSLKELYNDNFHDDSDTAFHGKRTK